jgi:hypothetical protein
VADAALAAQFFLDFGADIVEGGPLIDFEIGSARLVDQSL